LNHNNRDISYIFFFNCSSIYFLMNIYLDFSQTALKYLKDTKANINNILIMMGDFNIRDSFWDLLFPNYLVYSDILTNIADSLNLYIYLVLLFKFLQDMQTTPMIWIPLSILCFYNQIQMNLTTTLFIWIGDYHQITLHLQWKFWFLKNTSKPKNEKSSKIAKKKSSSLLMSSNWSKDLILITSVAEKILRTLHKNIHIAQMTSSSSIQK